MTDDILKLSLEDLPGAKVTVHVPATVIAVEDHIVSVQFNSGLVLAFTAEQAERWITPDDDEGEQ